MMSAKTIQQVWAVAICLLVLASGCGPVAKEGVKIEAKGQAVPTAVKAETATLALKFSVADSTTYRLKMQTERSLEFEGALSKDEELKGGTTGSNIELVFTQQIRSVDEKGNAAAKITIKELKFLSKIKDDIVFDFDSSRGKDRNSPLATLIGQSYTIEVTPAGEVSRVVDTTGAREAVRGASTANKAALRLISPAVIKERHTIALPAAGKNKLQIGCSWSSLKTYPLGMMGEKSYERIYTIKQIKSQNGQKSAVVEMDAIPSSKREPDAPESMDKMGAFADMFDSTETYTGKLKLDLTSGKVEQYTETMRTEWIAVDPQADMQGGKEPNMLKMSVMHFYNLEKIN